MRTLRQTRLRYAAHYKDVLEAADDLYLTGEEGIAQGLREFDMEWENIRAGQEWVARAAASDDEAAMLCSGLGGVGGNCLDLRLNTREADSLA